MVGTTNAVTGAELNQSRRPHPCGSPLWRWYPNAMKTTIDRAGRIVIPRTVRDVLGLRGGETVNVIERDGRIEIELSPTEMRLERRGRGLVAVSDEPLPTLSQEAVRETLERLRR